MTDPEVSRINVWNKLFSMLAAVALAVIVWLAWHGGITPAHGAQIQEKCTAESTGLKYTKIEGSGFASLFFGIPLLALAPLAGPTDVNGQYRCHLVVIGRDAVGAKVKRNYRPVAEPY